MIILDQDIENIKQHWTVRAISEKDMQKADELRKARLVHKVIGNQLDIGYENIDGDERLIQRVALAYELGALEGLKALLHPTSDNLQMERKSKAGAFLAYEYARVQRIPIDDEGKMLHVFRLIGLAYAGDRWSDIRRWIREEFEDIQPPRLYNQEWDQRILIRLYECWIRLIRKESWDDVDRIRELIAELREEQKFYEEEYLSNNNSASKFAAYRLIALYHWARATEILSLYMLQGEPSAVLEDLNSHFEASAEATKNGRDITLENVIRWLHVVARQMVVGSLWWTFQTINSRVSKFVKHVTKAQGMFELLPPQRAALQEQGLLDTANRAVVVNLPTSGGKTALAQFRMLLALNQFDADRGWVAYIAPTRALVSQITRRLRRDFGPIGVEVMQMTGAIDIDGFEEALLTETSQNSFDILVMTPEKLDLIIRNKKVSRPLVLVVVDEAHNIEDEDRGLRLELLLATIKRECDKANFLLLMPFVPNSSDLVEWLAPARGKTISLSTTPWQPNDRIVGIYDICPDKRDWTMKYETMITTQKTIHLAGEHTAGGNKPLDLSVTKARSLTNQTGAMAKIFSERGTSIAIGRKISDTWEMARNIEKSIKQTKPISEEISLVKRFLETELSPEFQLINLLNKRIGVHHAGLPDEVRSLMEWLAEIRELDVLCATSTITQGINFPVSSIFLSSRFKAGRPKGKEANEMSARDFWNLAGRAGRMDQDSVGVVGVAAGKDRTKTINFLKNAVESLLSTFVQLLDEVDKAGKLNQLHTVIYQEQWSAFRSYIAHLWNEKQNLEELLTETELLLRNTLGYKTLKDKVNDPKSQEKANALLSATKAYVAELAQKSSFSALADTTGFAPEGVGRAIAGLSRLENKLNSSDWEPESLFGSQSKVLQNLVGVMFSVTELAQPLDEIGGKGFDNKRIADITHDWVNGTSIEEIAKAYFAQGKELDEQSLTTALSTTCKAIYRNLTNYGTWGLASLSKLPNSGLDFDKMTDEERRRYNNLPAMIYYGVNSEAAILMRMNSIPRSIAESLGKRFVNETGGSLAFASPMTAKAYIKSLSDKEWEMLRPKNATMTGKDFKSIWQQLSGESS
ncbi:DEAD/DEAH box helicase [Brevibacillus sp. RS1.1]|uniref:DEAD/DEAH box helicase n=1 Tax=Brevibacillus sp. RS1.1 TaxID=2738982 RepID=UPI00156B6EF9|nr:DEAD/DEAH box helicase [Brevibacillus sp. RS1.1]NRR05504.1 DEAD/DEAH box helicase [Brevibacillus sp. RS1.1]